jgi:uncharacterized damage-inducible protein DinB
MNFSLDRSLEILENTPRVLSSMLNNLSEDWTTTNEGENTWSPKEVIAHLIVCEKTNWIIRAKLILSDSPDKTFIPIDMVAHFKLSKNNSLQELLKEFSQLRENAIKELTRVKLEEADFMKTAIHPKLGEVNLQQVIATWVTHDLAHITQISRVMAKQNKENVGPFETFLRILKS